MKIKLKRLLTSALALLMAIMLVCVNVGGNLAMAADFSGSGSMDIVLDYDADTSTDPADGSGSTSGSGSESAEEEMQEDNADISTDPADGSQSGDTSGTVSEPVIDIIVDEPDESIPDEAQPEKKPLFQFPLFGGISFLTDEEAAEAEEASDVEVEEAVDIDEITTGEREDVAETEVENSMIMTMSADSEAGNASDHGVDITYAADGVTTFSRDSLSAGQVWVDKSVAKTSKTETSFEETLSVYAARYTHESTYETGNYVLVLDTTRSLYLADESGSFIKALTSATNTMIADICKNPLSNVSVIGFSADHSDLNKYTQRNKNTYSTTVLLGMGNWSKIKNPLTCDVSASSELSWYIGATTDATNSKIASTGKRYISYGTFTQAGIAHAANILSQQTDKGSKAAYMILLTDGVPTFGTSSWVSAYTTEGTASSNVWRSEHKNILGEGKGAVPEAAAYVPLTAQYWKTQLAKSYKKVGFYSVLLSNDSYDSGDEKLAKWSCGVRNANSAGNNATYGITNTSNTKTNGYYGSVTTGWAINRVASGYTGSSTAELKTAASTLLSALKKTNSSGKAYWEVAGAQSATQIDTPIIAQFAAISNVSGASNKTTMLNHAYENLKTHLTSATYNTKAGALKSGTNVVFTTTTGKGMVVNTAPQLSYRNVKFQPTSTSGNATSGYTYSYNATYTLDGVSTKVTGSVTVKAGSQNNSVITVTIPANLVNEAGLANSTYPVKCIFGVDLYSQDYLAVCDKYGEKFTTFTNEYNSPKTTVTFTTDDDNPYYAATGTATVKKAANTTKTLDYVSSTAKGRSGTQSTATLGNNGRIDMELVGCKIEVLVWELNQADQTKILPNIPYHIEDANGNRVSIDGKPLSFTSTDKVITIEGVRPNDYYIVADSVPAGYVMPAPTKITVIKTRDTQHFDVYVPTILIDVWAIDKITGDKVDGVKATLFDKAGKAVYKDVSLEFIREYAPAGDYTIKVTTVPSRYILPDDTNITVKAIREKQDYIIPLEHLGSITVKKYDASHQPLAGVSFTLSDSNGKIIMQKTTDKNGQAVFMDDSSLVAGEYVLTETKTKAGLSLLSEPIHVTIPLVMTDAEVAAQKADTSKGWHNATEKHWYFYDVTYEISNNTNFAVPSTGGNLNYTMFCFMGLVGLLCGCYILLPNKKLAI